MRHHISQLANFPDRVFGTAEVTRMTGTTPREIQWWCEKGFLSPQRGPLRPSRRGRVDARVFTVDDVRLVWLIARLRRSLSLQQARLLIPYLREKEGYLLIEVGSNVCRGTHFAKDAEVIRQARASPHGVLVVDLGRAE